MWKNYLKIGIRNILKYRVFSIINIFGLATGMSICMLIILMMADQKSYDQFHEKKDQTYRILSKIAQSTTPNASSPYPLAKTIKEDYPIIEESTNLNPGVGGDATYGQQSVEMRGYFADASFFEVFSFGLDKGDPNHALATPNSMVITSDVAHLLFGNEDPIGKRVEFVWRGLSLIKIDFGSETSSNPVDWGSFTVTGVLDSKKFNSHLKFDVLVSENSRQALFQEGKMDDLTDNWERYSYSYTYVVLAPGQTEEDLVASLDDLVTRKYKQFEDLKGFKLIPQNLNHITPGIFVGNPSSLLLPIEAYYFLGFFAVLILVLACVNYTNLSIARALTRAKEIGIRKVNGANRKRLVVQFLSESILTAILALVLAQALLLLIKPAFLRLWANEYLNFDLRGSISVYVVFFGFALLIGLLAGLYPALHLSKFSPIKALYKLYHKMPGKFSIKKVLNISQFAVSLFFIITSILIYNQFRHYLEFDYGFNSANIVNIPIQGNNYQNMANELRSVPGVSRVSASEYIPATAMTNGIGARKSGSQDDFLHFEHMSIDTDFVDNLDLSIIAGRNFQSEESPGHYVLVNEAAVKGLGYSSPMEIIGQTLEALAYEKDVEIIGVLRDFKFQTPVMEDKIGPLMFRNYPENFSYLNVKIASKDLGGTISKLEDKWKSIDPVHPFKYQFFDDQLVKVNQWLGDLFSIISFIAFLAITIACLGILGMAIYTTERRTKEVGIRRVLGAGNLNIVLLLSKGFLMILMIAIFIGSPISYLVNQLWLQNFPNRVHFGWTTIILGAGILLVLGLVTVGSQTLAVSLRKPVDSLRSE